jgi:hypothetical protein
MKSHVFGFALLSVAAMVVAVPAQALPTLTRTFVSSTGADTSPCTITQPCATFARAYTQTVSSGIIAALDPGKYGPLTITMPITVDGYGWAAITGTASSYAIDVNTSGLVRLRGLILNGALASDNGIRVESTSTGTVEIFDCDISAFEGTGIQIVPAAATSVIISNTIVTGIGNDFSGAAVALDSVGGSINAVLDHVTLADSYTGLYVQALPSSGPIIATVSNSQIDNNSSVGINEGGGDSNDGVSVVLRNVVINQTPIGVQLYSYAYVYFSQTTITNVNGFPFTDAVYFYPGQTSNQALSDNTSHLTPSNGTILPWTTQ